jgi:hypothetical protein
MTGLDLTMVDQSGHYKHLSGTAPLIVTGSSNACVLATNKSTDAGGNCMIASGTDRNSFLRVDELHPSEVETPRGLGEGRSVSEETLLTLF